MISKKKSAEEPSAFPEIAPAKQTPASDPIPPKWTGEPDSFTRDTEGTVPTKVYEEVEGKPGVVRSNISGNVIENF